MTDERHTQLRAWAKGTYQSEAATELLLRFHGGRFASPGQPWSMTDEHGSPWIDFDAILPGSGALSSGERRMLSLVASLAGVGVEIDLGTEVGSLDHEDLVLVLAAINHAAGGNKGSRAEFVGGSLVILEQESLLPWPELPAGRATS